MPKIDFAELCEIESRIHPDFKGAAKAISHFLMSKGFDDLEYLGSGNFAMVIAPKNNKDFCLRIFGHDSTTRNPIHYLLQSIGKWHSDIPLGPMGFKTQIEALKRMDMNITAEELKQFRAEAEKHGSKAASLAGGREIGHYDFTDAAGNVRRVRMASDPSAINRPALEWEECTHEPHHPSLIDQLKENQRIARTDSRLAEFVPQLEKRIEEYSAGNVQPYLTARELEQQSKFEQRRAALREGRKDHPSIKQHQSGGRTD